MAGIAARDEKGRLIGAGSMPDQTRQCFANPGRILEADGASFEDVVKHTIFATDIERFNRESLNVRLPYYRARPAFTPIDICRLVDPLMLVEIEAVARPAG